MARRRRSPSMGVRPMPRPSSATMRNRISPQPNCSRPGQPNP
jgi:hypothetical protein